MFEGPLNTPNLANRPGELLQLHRLKGAFQQTKPSAHLRPALQDGRPDAAGARSAAGAAFESMAAGGGQFGVPQRLGAVNGHLLADGWVFGFIRDPSCVGSGQSWNSIGRSGSALSMDTSSLIWLDSVQLAFSDSVAPKALLSKNCDCANSKGKGSQCSSPFCRLHAGRAVDGGTAHVAQPTAPAARPRRACAPGCAFLHIIPPWFEA